MLTVHGEDHPYIATLDVCYNSLKISSSKKTKAFPLSKLTVFTFWKCHSCLFAELSWVAVDRRSSRLVSKECTQTQHFLLWPHRSVYCSQVRYYLYIWLTFCRKSQHSSIFNVFSTFPSSLLSCVQSASVGPVDVQSGGLPKCYDPWERGIDCFYLPGQCIFLSGCKWEREKKVDCHLMVIFFLSLVRIMHRHAAAQSFCAQSPNRQWRWNALSDRQELTVQSKQLRYVLILSASFTLKKKKGECVS